MFRSLPMRLSALALLVSCFVVSEARAQSLPRPALHWTRAANANSCIDPQQLALRVTALTGPVLVAASAADLSIEGHVTRHANGSFRARVTATTSHGTQRGERTLEQEGDCRKLDQALAFVIALLIDPDLVLQQLPVSLIGLGAEGHSPEAALLAELEAKPPAPVHTAPTPPSPAKPTPVAPPKPRRSRFSVAAGPSLAWSELPRTTLGAVASGALRARPWLALELSLRAGGMVRAQDVRGRMVRAQSYAASLLFCPRYPGARWVADLCLGPELALLHARGDGFSSDRSANLTIAGARAGAGLALHLTENWFVQLRGFGRVVFNRPTFTYSTLEGPQHAFSIQRLSANLELTAGYAF